MQFFFQDSKLYFLGQNQWLDIPLIFLGQPQVYIVALHRLPIMLPGHHLGCRDSFHSRATLRNRMNVQAGWVEQCSQWCGVPEISEMSESSCANTHYNTNLGKMLRSFGLIVSTLVSHAHLLFRMRPPLLQSFCGCEDSVSPKS